MNGALPGFTADLAASERSTIYYSARVPQRAVAGVQAAQSLNPLSAYLCYLRCAENCPQWPPGTVPFFPNYCLLSCRFKCGLHLPPPPLV
jgi:hypothetical protein